MGMKQSRGRNGEKPQQNLHEPMQGRLCPLIKSACAGAECAWWDQSHTVDGVQGSCIVYRVFPIEQLLKKIESA